MKVSVRLFAGLRERAGGQHVEVELPEGARVEDLLAAMGSTPVGPLSPGQCVVAINREYAARTERDPRGRRGRADPAGQRRGGLRRGRRGVRVTEEPLDVAALSAAVRDPARGRRGGVRGRDPRGPALDYEAYAEMAEARLRGIGEEEAERHGLCAVALEHRVGTVPLGRAERDRRRLGAAPRRGVRRRPRADRPREGRGADLEGRGRRRTAPAASRARSRPFPAVSGRA